MKRLALAKCIGKKQKEFIELAFSEGAPANMLSKGSRENLVWRVNRAFEENWQTRYDYEMGSDEPQLDRLKTCPCLRQGPDGLFRIYHDKTPNGWWLTCVGQ